MIKETIKQAVDAYKGGSVDRELVQAALDFMVAIQPASDDPDGGAKYVAALNEHGLTISSAQKILRSFGEMIEPPTLEAMQIIFYRVVDSPRYSVSADTRSCVYSCLNRAWTGVGPWQG